jgi:hypothetical protein
MLEVVHPSPGFDNNATLPQELRRKVRQIALQACSCDDGRCALVIFLLRQRLRPRYLEGSRRRRRTCIRLASTN